MARDMEYFKAYHNFTSALKEEVLGKVKFPDSTLDERLRKFYDKWYDCMDVNFETFREVTTEGLHPILLSQSINLLK